MSDYRFSDSRCRHCEFVGDVPVANVMLFIGDTMAESHYNWFCPSCRGINGAGGLNAETQVRWLIDIPVRVSAVINEPPAEIIERLEIVDTAPAVLWDDVLDFMLAVRATDYAAEAVTHAGASA